MFPLLRRRSDRERVRTAGPWRRAATLLAFTWMNCGIFALPSVAQRPADAAMPMPPLGDREGLPRRADRVERHGITFRFDREYTIGSFANGDPWVLGPVRVIAIDPATRSENGRTRHGAMVDPDPSTMQQGYDSACFGDDDGTRYDERRNVGAAIAAGEPLELRPPQSLVSVISREQSKDPPVLQRAAVLTCVAETPAPDAFRPPYVKGDKTMRYRVVDLDTSLLGQLERTADVPPIEVVALGFERLWLDQFPEWPVRYSHPLDNMPDYGRDIAAAVGSAALLLNTDLPLAQKQPLLVRFVQLGLDHHAALRAGCRWQGLGGHGHGRKLPILFAGRLLHDDTMLAIGQEFRSLPEQEGGRGGFFGEDTQTFFVRETSPGVFNFGHGGYGEQHVGMAEWGFSHANHPERDALDWQGNPYRRCCTANAWSAQVLAARVMGLVEAWNHPAFFAYVDRYLATPAEEPWHRAWVPWHASMWDRHREHL